MEDALRGAVRRSLAELARLLAGDKRAEMAPLFTVALALERTNRIELRPTVQAHSNGHLPLWRPGRYSVTKCRLNSVLAADVHDSRARSCSTWCMQQAKRLLLSLRTCPGWRCARAWQPPNALTRQTLMPLVAWLVQQSAQQLACSLCNKDSVQWRPAMQVAARSLPQPPSFQDNIATDEEAVSRPIAAITAAVTGIVDKVQTLLVYWEKKYQSVWDQDKEAYIRCAPPACGAIQCP